MRKLLFTAAILAAGFTATAQVGVNTETPAATLDVVGDATDTSEMDGIIAPRLTGDELRAKTYAAAQTGAMVYVTAADSAPAGQTIEVTEAGYYYFDGTKWLRYQASAGSKAFTNTVFVDNADPNSATTFDDVPPTDDFGDPNPGFTHDAALEEDSDSVYMGTDGSSWIWDGTNYVAYTQPASTEWYLRRTNIDAGSNKTALIERPGYVGVGMKGASSTSFFLRARDFRNPDQVTQRAGAFQIINESTNALTLMTGVDAISQNNANVTAGNLRGANIYTTSYDGTLNDLRSIHAVTENGGTSSASWVLGSGITTLQGSTTGAVANLRSGDFYSQIRANALPVSNSFYGINIRTVDGGAAAGNISNVRGIRNELYTAPASAATATNFYAMDNNINYNGAGVSGRLIGTSTYTRFNPNADTTVNQIFGQSIQLDMISTGSTNTATQIRGSRSIVNNDRLQYNNSMVGIESVVRDRALQGNSNNLLINTDMYNEITGDSDINDMYGLRVRNHILPSASGTVTNTYGISISNWYNTSGGASVTNSYMLHLSSLGHVATNNWSLYNDSSYDSYFKGNVGIGTNDPGSKLSVVGLPTGATQPAGLTAGDFWVTSGHATLPDGVVMIAL